LQLFLERFGDVVLALTRVVGMVLPALLRLVLGLAFFAMLAGVALSIPTALGWAIYRAFPDEIPQKTNAGWIDLIFSNQYVVFAARIVLIALALVLLIGGVYLTMSMFVRIARQEWLHKAGPFEAKVVDRADEQLEDVDVAYQEMLAEAWGENEELEGRLETALEDLEEVTKERDRLADELAGK
jgi:hypothetical protein